MRIVTVLCEFAPGGAETTALRWVRAMTARGHGIFAVAIRGGGPLAGAFAEAGALVGDGVSCRRRDPLAGVRVAGLVREFRADAVVVVDVARNALAAGMSAAMLADRPGVCWCNSIPGGQSGRFAGLLTAAHRAGAMERLVCTSRRQMREFARRGLPRSAMTLIRNGVELPTPAGRSREPDPARLTIIQVANVMPDKDFDTLLAAVGRLAARREDFELLLVGSGTDSPEMVRRIGECGAGDRVRALGRREDVPALLAAGDVFTLSTHSEVFSVATLEAMAAGLPVVVSDIPAFEEMLTDGVEALLVPPGDAGSLAGAIERLLDHAALRERLGAAGRARAAEFSVKVMTDRLEGLLASLVCGEDLSDTGQ